MKKEKVLILEDPDDSGTVSFLSKGISVELLLEGDSLLITTKIQPDPNESWWAEHHTRIKVSQ